MRGLCVLGTKLTFPQLEEWSKDLSSLLAAAAAAAAAGSTGCGGGGGGVCIFTYHKEELQMPGVVTPALRRMSLRNTEQGAGGERLGEDFLHSGKYQSTSQVAHLCCWL